MRGYSNPITTTLVRVEQARSLALCLSLSLPLSIALSHTLSLSLSIYLSLSTPWHALSLSAPNCRNASASCHPGPNRLFQIPYFALELARFRRLVVHIKRLEREDSDFRSGRAIEKIEEIAIIFASISSIMLS